MHDERKQMTEKQRDRHTMLVLGLEAVGLIVAAFAISFIAGGCGEKAEQSMAANSGQTVVAEPAGVVGALTPSQTAAEPENDPVAYADSLPPEVAASVADTTVLPGAAVEVTAEGSPDVTDVILWDGIGKRQAFVYDLEGKVWRTFYRVPMKPSADRLGLSVTAKNASGHWRRVWLFLNVGREGGAPQPDSTSLR